MTPGEIIYTLNRRRAFMTEDTRGDHIFWTDSEPSGQMTPGEIIHYGQMQSLLDNDIQEEQD
jgi:hypothetical protein